MFNAVDNTQIKYIFIHVHAKEFKRSTKIAYIIHAHNS